MPALYVDDLLASTYLAGGREVPYIDCWGLVRIVYERLFGVSLPLLETMKVGSVKANTIAYREMLKNVKEVEAQHGSIIAVFHGKLCVHVAIVIEIEGALYAFEMSEKAGVRTVPIKQYEAESDRIIYYSYA